MRRLFAATAVAVLACVPLGVAAAQHPHGGAGGGGAGGGGTIDVAVGYSDYKPSRLDVLTGSRVMWTNTSSRAHTVTADDQSFDSGRVSVRQRFSHEFGSAGTYPYYCRLHPTIRGSVDAHDLLLDPQPESAAPGRSYPVTGRSVLPAGTPVSIEADSGAGYAEVASAEVDASGEFSTSVTPTTTTRYRAVSGSVSSPPVELLVVDHTVTARGVRRGRAVVVSALVSPMAHGQTVVLQVRSRERFGWWPTRRARLRHSSRAHFVLRTRRRVRARVVLTRADGATPLAYSAAFVVAAARR
jgi:plastocyanin